MDLTKSEIAVVRAILVELVLRLIRLLLYGKYCQAEVCEVVRMLAL